MRTRRRALAHPTTRAIVLGSWGRGGGGDVRILSTFGRLQNLPWGGVLGISGCSGLQPGPAPPSACAGAAGTVSQSGASADSTRGLSASTWKPWTVVTVRTWSRASPWSAGRSARPVCRGRCGPWPGSSKGGIRAGVRGKPPQGMATSWLAAQAAGDLYPGQEGGRMGSSVARQAALPSFRPPPYSASAVSPRLPLHLRFWSSLSLASRKILKFQYNIKYSISPCHTLKH